MRGTDFFPGASVSYSTKRKSGFTALEFEGFRRMAVPLMATARIVTERFFTSELLEAYLGRRSGQSVLNGQIGRGEVRRINCALLYSDMWGSTALSQQMSPEAFLATLNRYFDCVAGAVLDHGGEVLKFIGDGLLAIFPFEDTRQSREDICATALLVAREAFDHSARIPDADKVKFGIALHAGEVIYGNVGTEKRLDFTVTGSAVAKVSRVEGLTRKLDAQLLATDTFARYLSEPAQHLGGFDLRGFDKNVEVVSYDISPQP
ncbi:MAG: adenylate/guanylate cyclase domain-containing protein, partial [Pseudomonadota bacterium]